jgi:hypothetical protein
MIRTTRQPQPSVKQWRTQAIVPATAAIMIVSWRCGLFIFRSILLRSFVVIVPSRRWRAATFRLDVRHLGPKVIDQAQPTLDVSEPLLIGGRPIPAAAFGNDDLPSCFLIRHYSKRRAGLRPSEIKLLRDEPTQIVVRDALLSHTTIRNSRLSSFKPQRDSWRMASLQTSGAASNLILNSAIMALVDQ